MKIIESGEAGYSLRGRYGGINELGLYDLVAWNSDRTFLESG